MDPTQARQGLQALDADQQRVLALVERYSDGATGGVPQALLDHHYRRLNAHRDLDGPLSTLLARGLMQRTADGQRLRPTPAGYALIRALPGDGSLFEAAPDGWRATRPVALSEYALRNAVLEVFRAFACEAGDTLGAAMLRRFWAGEARRAAELRHALDLLMRDGYLRVGRFRRTVFRLQPDGARYLRGRDLPPRVAALAPPARQQDRWTQAIPDDSLLVLAVQLFQVSGSATSEGLSLGELLHGLDTMGVPRFQQFHAADLLYRLRHVEIADPDRMQWVLTESGADLAAESDRELVQWLARMAINDARRSQSHD